MNRPAAAPPPTTVLLTHGEGRLEGLAAALAARGFSVTHHPLIVTEPLPPDTVRPSAAALLTSDWLLFTSRTAVQAWATLDLPLQGLRVGAVGAKTAAEIARLGGQVALSAQPENAQGLLETFVARVSPPASVGLPCGVGALPTLGNGLTRAGFAVARAPLYRTVARPFPDASADLIVLASPSAVAALPQTLRPETRLVALGPSTYEAAQDRGWSAVQAENPNLEGVVRAVLAAARDPLALPLETP
jgi:uroporphyrinogen-III synthase